MKVRTMVITVDADGKEELYGATVVELGDDDVAEGTALACVHIQAMVDALVAEGKTIVNKEILYDD